MATATAPVSRVALTLRRPIRFAKRSAGQPAFRPAGNGRLSTREKELAALYFQAFRRIPRKLAVRLIDGSITWEDYAVVVDRALKPTLSRIEAILSAQYIDSGVVIAEEIRRAVNGELRRLKVPVQVEKSTLAKADTATVTWGFDTENPRASAWARNESSLLVTNMEREQRDSVRDLMGRAHSQVNLHQATGGGTFGSGMTRRQTSSALIDLLQTVEPTQNLSRALAAEYGIHANGLTVQYERAVSNFAAKTAAQLEARGIIGEKALKEVREKSNKYADRLRRSRSKTIARTEINAAANAGRQQSMEDAIDAGVIDERYAVKQWAVASMDVCPVCVPMAGKVVGVRSPFSVSSGSSARAKALPPVEKAHPPAHPNCRCTIQLVPHVREGIPAAIGNNIPGAPNRLYRPPIGHPERGSAGIPSLTSPQVVGTPTQAAAYPDDLPDALDAMSDAARKNPAHRNTMEQALGDDSPEGALRRRFGKAEQPWSEVRDAGTPLESTFHGTRHAALEDIRTAQGFDALPDLLSDEQLDALISQGGQEMFRGEASYRYMDALKEGDFYPSQGVFGNGTYFDGTGAGGVGPGDLGDALRTAERYAGSERGRVVRAVLKPDARTVEYSTFKNGAEAAAQTMIRRLDEVLGEIPLGDGSVTKARQAVRALVAELKAARSVDQAVNLQALGLSADDPVGFLQLIDDVLVENGVTAAYEMTDWLRTTYAHDPGMLSATLGYDAITGVGMGTGAGAEGGSYVIVNNRSAIAMSDTTLTHAEVVDAVTGPVTGMDVGGGMREALGLTPID